MKKFVPVLFASIAITGTASAASLTEEAQKLETQYVDAFNHKGAPAQFFTADGVAVAQNGSVTRGRDNLKALYSKIMGHFTISATLTEVHSMGNGGWSLATGEQTFPDGHVVKAHSVYVYERENGVLRFRAFSIGVDVLLPHKTACNTPGC